MGQTKNTVSMLHRRRPTFLLHASFKLQRQKKSTRSAVRVSRARKIRYHENRVSGFHYSFIQSAALWIIRLPLSREPVVGASSSSPRVNRFIVQSILINADRFWTISHRRTHRRSSWSTSLPVVFAPASRATGWLRSNHDSFSLLFQPLPVITPCQIENP